MKLSEFTTAASAYAAHVDALFTLLSIISGVVVALVSALIVIFLARYHRGSRAPRGDTPERWDREVEIGWTAATFFTFLFLFWWAASDELTALTAPKHALEIHVVAKQWMWKVQHSEGRAEINELHVPLGRPITVTMTSEDVIHSFFVPAFRVKQDVLPGRRTSMWFEPTRIGRYHLFCAEYCGTNHSTMGGWVEVMEPAEFESWLSQTGSGPSMADQGERLFVQYHCAGCHRGSQIVNAPRLEGIYGRPVPIQQGNEVRFTLADDRYVRDSILRPKQEVVAGYQPLMPSFEGQINESDLFKIIAYIKSIGAKEAAR
jgi:cytochrome c oxidase subunit II